MQECPASGLSRSLSSLTQIALITCCWLCTAVNGMQPRVTAAVTSCVLQFLVAPEESLCANLA